MYGNTPGFQEYLRNVNVEARTLYYNQMIVPQMLGVLNSKDQPAYKGTLSKFQNFRANYYLNSKSRTKPHNPLYVSGYNDYSAVLDDILKTRPKLTQSVAPSSAHQQVSQMVAQNNDDGMDPLVRRSYQELERKRTGVKRGREDDLETDIGEGPTKKLKADSSSDEIFDPNSFGESEATVELRPNRYKGAEYVRDFPGNVTKNAWYFLRVVIRHKNKEHAGMQPVFSVLEEADDEYKWAKDVKFIANLSESKQDDWNRDGAIVDYLFSIKLEDTTAFTKYRILISLKTGTVLFRSSPFKVISRRSDMEKQFWEESKKR